MSPGEHVPDPRGAGTPAEFRAHLQDLKERSGLTYRELAARAAEHGDVLPRSTVANMLARATLPREELLTVFVRACGLPPEEAEVWRRARNRLARREPYGDGGTGPGADRGADGGTGGSRGADADACPTPGEGHGGTGGSPGAAGGTGTDRAAHGDGGTYGGLGAYGEGAGSTVAGPHRESGADTDRSSDPGARRISGGETNGASGAAPAERAAERAGADPGPGADGEPTSGVGRGVSGAGGTGGAGPDAGGIGQVVSGAGPDVTGAFQSAGGAGPAAGGAGRDVIGAGRGVFGSGSDASGRGTGIGAGSGGSGSDGSDSSGSGPGGIGSGIDSGPGGIGTGSGDPGPGADGFSGGGGVSPVWPLAPLPQDTAPPPPPFRIRRALVAAVALTGLVLAGVSLVAALRDGPPTPAAPREQPSRAPAASVAAPAAGEVRIRVAGTGFCLGERRGARSGQIRQLPCAEADMPRYALVAAGAGRWRITSDHPDFGPGCSGLPSGGRIPGAAYEDSECGDPSRVEIFALEPFGTPVRGHRIVPVGPAPPGGCVTVTGDRATAGARLAQAPCAPDATGQLFSFEIP
ncbi:helix-turn-helix domain-containing protein [Streptomyces sp. NPDC059247]|uniref:helix-turn-helix domain-containing protein n=1 Tax=Streptomyces sp. NPDC059247 TaxID=3346790 RepID=UPI0036824FBA